MGVAIGELDRNDAILDREKGDIEGAAAEVEYQNQLLLLGLTIESVRDGGSCGRLVDDTEDVETRHGAGVLGGLALSIVEVSGDGDDSRRDWLGKILLGLLFQLGE